MYSVHVFLDSDVSCHRFINQLFIFKIKVRGQVSYDNKDVTYIHTICTSTRRLERVSLAATSTFSPSSTVPAKWTEIDINSRSLL